MAASPGPQVCRLMKWSTFRPLPRQGAGHLSIRRTLTALSLAIAVTLAGCSGGGDGTGGGENGSVAPRAPEGMGAPTGKMTGDPASGRVVYEKYCHYCHGRTGRGDGAVGIAISPRPLDFVSDRAKMSKTDAELMASITYGIKRETGGEQLVMPRWKEILSEQERWDVLAYVRLLSEAGREETGAGGGGGAGGAGGGGPDHAKPRGAETE